MMADKLTDKEIIKALECCINSVSCHACPRNKDCDGLEPMRNALDLINRQQAEIERLTNKVEELSEVFSDTIRIRYAECKAEAIKEFAERLKDDSWFTDLFDRNDYPVRAVTKDDIDNLVKEMAGEQE